MCWNGVPWSADAPARFYIIFCLILSLSAIHPTVKTAGFFAETYVKIEKVGSEVLIF